LPNHDEGVKPEVTRINPSWEVSVSDVKAMLDSGANLLLLDVRQPEEHAIGRIDGAHLLPLPDLPNRIDEIRELAGNRQIVTLCHHGGRSLNAAAILRQGGLMQSKSMAGGIDAWSVEIDPRIARY